jgi:hypothetical protein
LPPIQIDGAQLALGGIQFLKNIRICFENKLPCVGYDEAGDFNRRGSLSNFNAMLNRTFETFRAFKCIVVLGLPNFNVLDNQLFDNQIPRMLLHLHDRTQLYGNFKAFDLEGMNWLRYWMHKSPIKSYAWQHVFPNFQGHFKDLSSERSAELDKLSTKNKLNILRKSEIKIEGLMSYADMATKLFKSISYVRQTCNNLEIKPQRIVEKIKYFDQDALNRLAEALDISTESARAPRKRKQEI